MNKENKSSNKKKPIYKNKKLIVVVIILVVIITLASIMFGINSIQKANEDDISLHISMKENQREFNNGTDIISTIKLKNIAGHPIKLRAPFSYYIDIYVIYNGQKFREKQPDLDYAGPDWEILWNSEPIYFKRSLDHIDFEGPNGTRNNNLFKSPGEFEIYCALQWTSGESMNLEMNKESNHITIEVIE